MPTRDLQGIPADELMPAAVEDASGASAVVITCSALYRDITGICRANGWSHLDVQCITAELHNRPEKITAAVKALIDAARDKQQDVFVAYGDCGTGGQLDRLLDSEGVTRVPGAHCYEFFAGADRFEAFSEAEIGTFYLTDFLVRHFDRLVIRGLGIDKHPELEPMYFGHYRKLLYIAQSHDPDLIERARAAAARLGVEYEFYYGGSGELGTALEAFNRRIAVELKE